jgi:prepilin signal peptidase PulO-like enzyme (type II secretory pathway)
VSGFFYLIYFISKKKWIGGGDVKLGLWIGWLSGWQMAYLMLLVAYVLGAVVAVALLALKKKKMNSQVPFGPFLVLGCLIVLFCGESVIQWWKKIIFNF